MKTTLLAGAALAIGLTGAHAADFGQPVQDAPYLPPLAGEPVVSSASGWYLRGDVGYAWNRSKGVNFFQGSSATYSSFDTAELRSSYTVGGGVGYQATRRLRFDATLDYIGKTDFTGSTSGSCGVATDCVSTDLADFTAYSLLANVYVDVATWGRVTGYVGGGIGGTYVDWDNLSNTSCDAADSTSCDPTVWHEGDGSWRFTYALMAGASVDLTCALKADVGYRFRNVEGGRMFGYALGGGPGYDEGFQSHEVRGGLRYSFGGCETPPEPPVYMPPPVYK
ncbi:outer membrane protein [Pseudohoeflea coraliihabitans]|uniref:Porin family protein n=1 Tax=Pseudohoeflea coraliihabitans TaxID=2860393 RepID=A0ABS6WKW1_9HYPH|nr:outer membrane protein [Pseudohoeflea sp. DP4N28-3]MBW3096288.1 porin family protein [Pseudohoeflea sp. DP4N28-3]